MVHSENELRKNRIAAVTLLAAVLVIMFVPVLYSDHPCIATYGSVSYRVFDFGGVYYVGWTGISGSQVDVCRPPHVFAPAFPYYEFKW